MKYLILIRLRILAQKEEIANMNYQEFYEEGDRQAAQYWLGTLHQISEEINFLTNLLKE